MVAGEWIGVSTTFWVGWVRVARQELVAGESFDWRRAPPPLQHHQQHLQLCRCYG